MYKTILVALDLSPHSTPLLEKALKLASVFNATVHVAHGVDQSPLAFADDLALPVEEQLMQSVENAAHKTLESICQQYGIHESHIHIGNTSLKPFIKTLIAEISADLLVLGTHEHHGIDKLFGSTAATLLKELNCDALAIYLE